MVGVLSGADSEEALLEAGADVICTSITDLPLPLVHVPQVQAVRTVCAKQKPKQIATED